MPTINEIMEALAEGRISFNEAIQMLMQAGFSGELRSFPMVIQRQEQPQFKVTVIKKGAKVGHNEIPKYKDMLEHKEKKAEYCDVCKVYLADADRELQELVGRKLCKECVVEVVEKLKCFRKKEEKKNE